MIGPPSYEGSSGSGINVPGTSEYRVRATALSPPPPYIPNNSVEMTYRNYAANTPDTRAESSQKGAVTRVDKREPKQQNSIKTSAQITTVHNISDETSRSSTRSWTNHSNASSRIDSRISRSETRTNYQSHTTDRQSSDIGEHLEFI